eukprot:11209781-Lingulodinium_polyedra.AAC.1
MSTFAQRRARARPKPRTRNCALARPILSNGLSPCWEWRLRAAHLDQAGGCGANNGLPRGVPNPTIQAIAQMRANERSP